MVPGQLGFAVFSPPLDRRGNSVRGIAVCEQLSQHFNLHVNSAHSSGSSVVRRVGYVDHGAFEVIAGLVALTQESGLVVLEGCTEPQMFARGTTVFSEGDPADRMFFLLSGRVSVQLAVGDHTRRLASIGPGAAFGEMALLDEGSRSSTVVADNDVVCRALSRHALTDLEHGPPAGIASVLFRNLAKSLSARLRETNETVRTLE